MSPNSAGRWSLAALVVVLALLVAIWPRDREATETPDTGTAVAAPAPADRRSQDDAQALAPLRTAAALRSCPAPTGASPAGPLTGLTLECVSDGSAVDLAAVLAGRPAVLNLWAWWCGPCAEELPVLDDYARRAGDAVTVLTVHADPNESNALGRLTDYSVRLPGVQDGSGRVQAAVGAPPVLPVTVLMRPDGSVAKVLPQPFRSADEVAAAVETHLGVAV
ncbi:TlpA family protein disulfide reductase [Rhodococcus chondri]|uniref:TlpA disulfide reductase family protein n=1 Tax=Rhodococcus chondri TaxID=3065941 RepID=A0ABU7JWN8_9NOCA|nr:TlpA disulfide reductase family protein [Rhodococcus sp. CC-R104]MEE2034329.1 TlpA disulfide reductase family protein [Rhodococcus sp. CC-R104]